MSFFIPSFGGQGGGGVAPAPSNAFTGAALQGNILALVRDNGGRVDINLADILPTDTITNIALNGNDLVITKTDGSVTNLDLSPLLANNIVDAQLEGKNQIKFTHGDGNETMVDLPYFPIIDEENVFDKENTFLDTLLSDIVHNNSHYGANTSGTGGRTFGIRSLSSSLYHDGYVESVRIHLHSNAGGVTAIPGVSLWGVRKGATTTDDEVAILLQDNITCPVITEGTQQYIEIIVGKKFDEDTYFIYYLPGSNQYRFTAIRGLNAEIQKDYINTTNPINVGDRMQVPNDTYSIYAELRGRISVKDKLLNSYTSSTYDPQTGELTLTRHDGTNVTHTLSVGGNYVQSFNYDVDTRTITVTDENGQQHIIEHIITEWDDLDFVSKTRDGIRNIFNKITQVRENNYFTPNSSGGYSILGSDVWDLAYIPVIPGQDITIIKNNHDSRNYAVYNSQGVFQQHISQGGTPFNGMQVYRMKVLDTLPTNEKYFLLINMHKGQNNPVDPNKLMVFDGNIPDHDLPKEYIPYAKHGSIYIDGNEVVHTFNPTGSSLVSQNTQDAIIELDRKITITNESSVKTINNQTPDAQGNIRLELQNTQDVINFNVEGHTINSITYATQQEIDDLKLRIII